MTAVSLDRDPPAWATALARHRDGLREMIRFLVEADPGYRHPLNNLLAAIPADEREPLIKGLQWANENDGLCAFDSALDALVFAYETHVAAAYQHGPHLGRWQDATRVPTVEEQSDRFIADLELIPVTVVEVQR